MDFSRRQAQKQSMYQYDTLQDISSLICNKLCVDQQSGHNKNLGKIQAQRRKNIFEQNFPLFKKKFYLLQKKNRHKTYYNIKSTYSVNKFTTNV